MDNTTETAADEAAGQVDSAQSAVAAEDSVAPAVVVVPTVLPDSDEDEAEDEGSSEENTEATEAPAESAEADGADKPDLVIVPVVAAAGDNDEEEEDEEAETEETATETPAETAETDDKPDLVIVPVVAAAGDNDEEDEDEEAETEETATETPSETAETDDKPDLVIVPIVGAASDDDEDDDGETDDEDDEEASEPITTVETSDNDVIVPIVITDDGDDDEESATTESDVVLDDDADDDAGEDKKVFSGGNGNRIYVTYDYSFRSKLIQSSEDVQSRYAIISDTLQSYGLRRTESWKKERYHAKNKTYANMIFRGKTLCVCLAIDPETLEGTKYFYENVGSIKKYEKVPVMVRVRSGRGCKYTLELIKMMLEGAGFKQIRPVSDTFTFHKPEDKMTLVEMGYIKVMMTNGEGEPIAADFEAMKNMKFNLSAGMPILKKVTAEEAAAIPDTEVQGFIETETVVEDEVIIGRRKGIINIDTISDAYKDGDTVTLQNLIARKLVAKNIGFIKVLARGTLDKALTVKANDFSIDAAKMIVIAGGSVIKLKAQK